MDSFSFGEFMREGGWGMWPILLLGLAALASAVRYATRPDRQGLRFVAALWLTLMIAVVHASITDVAAVFGYFQDPGRAPDPQIPRTLLIGLKESTRPAVLGGIFLTLVPLLGAVGIFREGTSRAATSATSG
ncbi:MAG TPA: hypothetical protein VKQ32_23000 [Polyangia bacterium]|nr:hypothetical protein [Polyangia bacterium]